MKRNTVAVIYDDSRPTGTEVQSITGKVSYGDTILKRRSLRERTEDILKELEHFGGFYPADSFSELLREGRISKDCPVFRLFSDFIIKDRRAVDILLEKACYADEPYRVAAAGKEGKERLCAVIFPTPEAYISLRDEELEGYDAIRSDAFIDISDINNFRQFITSGFDARFFNALSGNDYVVVKSSKNKAKIRAEYEFYRLLPEQMRMWFVSPFDYRETEENASYSMERYHFTDLALRYVHGAIGEEEFDRVLDKLFYFIRNRKTKKVSREEYAADERALYVTKVKRRFDELKTKQEYAGIEKLLSAGTQYSSIDQIADRYFSLYERITGGRDFEPLLCVGHGDLCFSNILYNKEADILKLIDPRGALKEEELYMNPFYDICKLSHSVCGSYDYFNSGMFEISLSETNTLTLSIDSDNERYIRIFKKKLSENGCDYRLIRLYEASLFLSMLPLHIDRRKKVLGFILNAVRIMDEVEVERK